MTWLISYHVVPVTVAPAQVALQEPSVTVVSTPTCQPVNSVVAIRAPVVGPVRRRTPSQAAAIVVVARALRGRPRETAPIATRAMSSAVPNGLGAA
ncbi:MAG: hypothetical protein HY262_10710 [Chloroflexi bacterium]|nr:hypothetical protein [Chloroflexota bacterium]